MQELARKQNQQFNYATLTMMVKLRSKASRLQNSSCHTSDSMNGMRSSRSNSSTNNFYTLIIRHRKHDHPVENHSKHFRKMLNPKWIHIYLYVYYNCCIGKTARTTTTTTETAAVTSTTTCAFDKRHSSNAESTTNVTNIHRIECAISRIS